MSTTSALVDGTIKVSANGLFVTMSYFISVLGAFTTFTFIHELRYTKSRLVKLLYIVLSSLAIGVCGIWSMHFIGTICFSLNKVHKDGTIDHIEITYDIGVTIASAIVAAVLCFVGFLICTIQLFIPAFTKITGFASVGKKEKIEPIQQSTKVEAPKQNWFIRQIPSKRGVLSSVFGNKFKPHFIQILIGALFLASGVVVMHYLGMVATKTNGAYKVYKGGVIFASIAIAYIVSIVALWLAFNLENEYQQVFSSLIAGIAVCGMHYTGMVSATYLPREFSTQQGKKLNSYDMTLVITLATTVTCFVMLIITNIANRKRTSLITRTSAELQEQKARVEESVTKLNELVKRIAVEEQQTRRVMELVSDGVCVINPAGEIIKVNTSFERLVGINKNNRGSITGVLALDLKQLFEDTSSSFHLPLNKTMNDKGLSINTCVEVVDGMQFCILIVKQRNSSDLYSSKRYGTLTQRVSDLEKAIRDRETFEQFREFCQREYCTENIDFVSQVDIYKNCSDILKRVEMQQTILKSFIQLGSPQQLNLPEAVLLAECHNINDGYGQQDLFNSLEEKVKEILLDSYFRFSQQTTTPRPDEALPSITAIISESPVTEFLPI
jgi:NO-binding membrane sensor protein with MHYT domain